MPQITIGTKEKWQPYLSDLSIIIWVDQIPHTHQRQGVKVKKTNKQTNKKPEELWCKNTSQFLVVFKKN